MVTGIVAVIVELLPTGMQPGNRYHAGCNADLDVAHCKTWLEGCERQLTGTVFSFSKV